MARGATVYLILSILLVSLPCPPLDAHPLGNFAICHYSGLTISDRHITIKYLIDMAEIPTFQEMVEIDQDQNKEISAAEKQAYLDRKVESLRKGLRLRVNGQPLALTTRNSQLEFPPGAGGLPTLKITATYRAALNGLRAEQAHRVHYEDTNYPDRLGWKEIIIRGENAVRLADIAVVNQDRSRELSAYPEDMLSSPPQDIKTQFTFAIEKQPGPLTAAPPVTSTRPASDTPAATGARKDPLRSGAPAESTDKPSAAGAAQSQNAHPTAEAPVPSLAPAPSPATTPMRGDSFTALIQNKDLSLNVILFALLVAFVLGAGHALSPGHGKTIVAAYLVGSRGTAKHAVFLGATVTLTHTIGVFALGLVTLFASRYIVPEKLYPWLGFSSGLVVAVIGLRLFSQRYRGLHDHDPGHHHRDHHHDHHANGSALEPAHAQGHSASHSHVMGHTEAWHEHIHSHEVHGHSHDHSHDHGHDHDHGDGPHHHHGHHGHHHHIPGNGEVTVKNLLALGVSGGIVPCPSALVVLLSAIALHRIGFGLVLILAFSLGLALVLTTIGLLMVYARRFLDGFTGQGRLLQRLPVFSSLVITALGFIIAVQALVNGGILPVKW